MTDSVTEEDGYMDEDVIVMDDILEVDDISLFEESADPVSIPLQAADVEGETTNAGKEEDMKTDKKEEERDKAQLVDVIEIHDDESFDVLFDDTQNDLDADLVSKNTSAEKEEEEDDSKAEDIPISEKKSEKKSEGEDDNEIEAETKSVDEKKKQLKSDGKSLNTKSSAATVKDKDNKKDDKGKEGTNCNLWVSGISSSTRANDLKSLFNKHVKVVGAKIMTNARAPGSRCYGYIILSTPEDATKCIKQLHNTDFHGKSIQVSYERPNNDVSPQSKVNTSHGKEKKVQDKKSVDVSNKDKSGNGRKEVRREGRKLDDGKRDKKKTEEVKSGNSTAVKSRNNKVPLKDTKRDLKTVSGNNNTAKGKSTNTGKGKTIISGKQQSSAPRKESNVALLKRKNSGKDEKKNIAMRRKSDSDVNTKNSKTVKRDLNKSDGKKVIEKSTTDDKSKPPVKTFLKGKMADAQKFRKSVSSGSIRDSSKTPIGRRNPSFQKDRSTSVHSKSSDKTLQPRSRAAEDKWEIEEKSKRLKVVHIQQKEEARKLQEERDEIRRVKKELEWRKYESYQQEQMWREQMERELKEREWEEKRILEEIRIEEEERLRYEEEQRRLAYEEEQRRIAEQERLEEEERIRQQEKQRYEEEQKRLMKDQWRTLEADQRKPRHHEQQHRDQRSSGGNRHHGHDQQRHDQHRHDQQHHDQRHNQQRHDQQHHHDQQRHDQQRHDHQRHDQQRHDQHHDRRNNNHDHWERREREKAQWKEREMQKEKLRKEQERLERERKEKERLERERHERERMERERMEREQMEREKLERERRERERLEREIKEKEQKERERLEKERLERERLEREKAQKEREKQELAERIKELEKEKEERIRREKKLLEELRQEKEQLKKEAMKRSYESRQVRDDYPPPAKRLNMPDDRYHTRRSVSPRRSSIDRNDPWDREISRREDRNPRDDHRGDDSYHSGHNERDRGYHHDDRHIGSSHGYSSHGDYDDRNRRQSYDDRGRNLDRKEEHHGSSKDWDRRDVSGYRDSVDERGYDIDGEGVERTVTLYKKSKDDRDHSNSRNRDLGYNRGQDQNTGYDRGRNDEYKGRKEEYHTRIRDDNIKREPEVERNRNFDKKIVQKGRANDDLWRNAGYGKSNVNERINQNMNFHGNTGAQTNWSNTGRDKNTSSGQNTVRSGNNFQPSHQPARVDKRGPVWGSGGSFQLSSNQFQHNSHSSSSVPLSDNRHSSHTSFPTDTRLNPSLINENLLSAQQTNIFGNARLNTPAMPSSVHTMPLVHQAVGSASQPIIQHPQQGLVNQPPVGMMPRPGVPVAGQQSFLNVGFKYYTPGRF